MPNFVLQTNAILPGIIANMGNDANAHTFVLAGVTVGSTGNNVLAGTGNNQSYTIAGNVWGSAFNPILAFGTGSIIQVLAGGSVIGTTTINEGAVNLGGTGGGHQLSNHGTISGGAGMFISVDSAITNTGTIASVGRGFENSLAFVSAAIILSTITTRTIDVDNSGTMAGSVQNDLSPFAGRSLAIYEFDYLIPASGFEADVMNTGLLDGEVHLAALNDRLINSGTVAGMVDMGQGLDRVQNTGTILDAVHMGEGIDLVTNAGLILGDVLLEGDQDVYNGLAQGIVTGFVLGGEGDDDLRGSEAVDQLSGDAGPTSCTGAAATTCCSAAMTPTRSAAATAATSFTAASRRTICAARPATTCWPEATVMTACSAAQTRIS